jgi:hypothetical protein
MWWGGQAQYCRKGLYRLHKCTVYRAAWARYRIIRIKVMAKPTMLETVRTPLSTFFVWGDTMETPPLDESVLLGITNI